MIKNVGGLSQEIFSTESPAACMYILTGMNWGLWPRSAADSDMNGRVSCSNLVNIGTHNSLQRQYMGLVDDFKNFHIYS